MLYQLSYASSPASATADRLPTGILSGGRNVRGHTPTFRVHGTEIKVSTPPHSDQTRKKPKPEHSRSIFFLARQPLSHPVKRSLERRQADVLGDVGMQGSSCLDIDLLAVVQQPEHTHEHRERNRSAEPAVSFAALGSA